MAVFFRPSPATLIAFLTVATLTLECACQWSSERHVAPGQSLSSVGWREVWPHLEGVWTTDGSRVWVVGEGGGIFHSEDSGATWTNQPTGTANALQGIFAANDGKSLWAVGAYGIVLSTQDSGTHWQSVKTPTVVLLNGIYGTPDGTKLWAVGAKGVIVESGDAGRSWRLSDSSPGPDLNSVYADVSGRNVLAVGNEGVILKRQGDGRWSSVASNRTESLKAVHGSQDGRLLFAAGDSGLVLVSDDAGDHWTSEHCSSLGSLRSVFSDSEGHRAWTTNENGEVFIRTGPGSWEKHGTHTDKYLIAIRGTPDGSRLWIAGGRGTILSSQDSGLNWKILRPRPESLSVESIASSRDGRMIAALASEGKMIASTDGGENWSVYPVGDSKGLHALFASQDGTRLWAAGDNGRIVRSHDGGRTWISAAVGVNRYRALIGTPDGATLWAGGDEGTLWKSTDSGQTWTALDSTTGSVIFGFFRCADGQLWAATGLGVNVGLVSLILHSKDDGRTWSTEWNGGDLDLHSIFATGDGKNIWAAGSGGSVVSSNNGGETWTIRRVTQAGLWHVTGDLDGRRIWAVGEKGTMVSYDPGNGDWTVQPQRDTDELTTNLLTAGGTLWAAGEEGAVLRSFPADPLPVNLAATLISGPAGAVVAFEPDWGGKPPIYLSAVRLQGGSPPAEDRYATIAGPPDLLPGASSVWRSPAFDPRKKLNVDPGGSLQIRIELGTEAMHRSYIPPPFTYDQWHWFRENRSLLSSAGVAAGVILVLTAMLFFRPLWLLAAYRHAGIYDAVEKIALPGLSTPLKAVLKATLLPYFAQHERTLDAWVAAHIDVLRSRFEAEPAVAASQGYVPLPMRLGDPLEGELIDKPTSELLSAWCGQRARMLVDIVGPGGSGKTTLAIQTGRWALEGRLSGHPMIPLIVDAETTNTVDFAGRKLAVWLDGEEERLPVEILNALLHRKRLLLIFDRLSERSTDMREHVHSLHSTSPVNAMIVTARHLTRFWVKGEKRLFPQALDSSTLLYFVQTLLTRGVFGTSQEQLELAQRIVAMIRVGRKEMPMTPLLVRLYVTKATALASRGASLDELPRSIPEAYFDYLRNVNPEDSSRNGMTAEEMLQAAELIAELALRGNLVPKEVLRSELRKQLLQSGWPAPARLDPVERLISNGVLVERAVAAETFVRFILDPVAEYLGGMAMARECGKDAARWQQLLQAVDLHHEEAPGFRNALLVLVQTYGKEFAWPVFVSDEGEFAQSANA